MALRLAILEAMAVFAAVWVVTVSQAELYRPQSLGRVAGHALALALCIVTAFYYSGLYELQTARRFGPSAARAGLALLASVALLGAVHGLPAGCPMAPAPLAAALLAALSLVLALRGGFNHWMARRQLVERVLIVGGGPLAHELVDAIESRPDRGQRVLGLIDDDDGRSAAPRLHLGRLADLDRIVERLHPDRVIVALASRRGRMPFKTLMDLRVHGTVVEDGVDSYERLTGKVPIEALTPTSLIFSKDSRSSRRHLVVAWSLSLPAAVLGLVVLAPLLGLIALAIKLDSPGPVFFVQPRVGRGGRLFRLIKFRTMRPVSDTTSEWARDNHGRLTRIGRWLRRFRLDELPQFINILKGDMSLIGPRPHPVSNLPALILVTRNTPECGEQIPFYSLRSLVRPGLTGWAQVRYRYANDLEEEIEKIRYDLYYVKHRSLWLDLRILAETVKIVVRGRESAVATGTASGPVRTDFRATPQPIGVPVTRARTPLLVEAPAAGKPCAAGSLGDRTVVRT